MSWRVVNSKNRCACISHGDATRHSGTKAMRKPAPRNAPRQRVIVAHGSVPHLRPAYLLESVPPDGRAAAPAEVVGVLAEIGGRRGVPCGNQSAPEPPRGQQPAKCRGRAQLASASGATSCVSHRRGARPSESTNTSTSNSGPTCSTAARRLFTLSPQSARGRRARHARDLLAAATARSRERPDHRP